MSNYIILMKLTDQGAKAIKDAPGRIETGIKGFEAMGGKVTGFYAVTGEYDYVAVSEAPNDEVATTFSEALARLQMSTTTLQGIYDARVCRDGEEVTLAVTAKNGHPHLVVC